jgi:hypothetical protein
LKLALNIIWWFLLFAKIQIIILSRKITEQIYACIVHKVARDDLNLEFFFYISQKFNELFNDDKILKLFAIPREMIMETAKLLIYGISQRNKEI